MTAGTCARFGIRLTQRRVESVILLTPDMGYENFQKGKINLNNALNRKQSNPEIDQIPVINPKFSIRPWVDMLKKGEYLCLFISC